MVYTMTMTPQERAVVQAAIAFRHYLASIADEAHSGAEIDLADAIDALIYSCSDCNRGGHTCPGDGESIGHGDTDCGNHDETYPAPDDAAEPIWVSRTWVDVRTGDDVHLPGTENYAHVQRAVHLRWHVDPRSGTSSYNPPRPLEWSGVHVTLYTTVKDRIAAANGMGAQASEFTMDPAKPIEIKTTQLEVDAIDLLGGWPARVGVVTQ